MLQEGDVFILGPEHTVYACVPKHFLPGGYYRGDFSPTRTNVKLSECDWIQGRYVVTKTAMDGGSNGGRDNYPNGHHVWAERVTDRFKVDFYQSGCFTAMITDVPVVGRARLKWAVEEPDDG